MSLDRLNAVVSKGESSNVEFKSSTGELKGGMETLCAFLNGEGGTVLFGVRSNGRIAGQTISDATLRDVANEIAKLEPAATIVTERVQVAKSNEVLILRTTTRSAAPYTYHGRPFRRVASTTSQMPQSEYHRRLLEREHSSQRWENQVATGYRSRDLDSREVRRTIREGQDSGRIDSAITGPTEALRKLHMVRGDDVIQAAVVAFAKDVEPSYPQCSRHRRLLRTISECFAIWDWLSPREEGPVRDGG